MVVGGVGWLGGDRVLVGDGVVCECGAGWVVVVVGVWWWRMVLGASRWCCLAAQQL